MQLLLFFFSTTTYIYENWLLLTRSTPCYKFRSGSDSDQAFVCMNILLIGIHEMNEIYTLGISQQYTLPSQVTKIWFQNT